MIVNSASKAFAEGIQAMANASTPEEAVGRGTVAAEKVQINLRNIY